MKIFHSGSVHSELSSEAVYFEVVAVWRGYDDCSAATRLREDAL